MAARTIMIQGTGSYVGKSVVTAALCRYFRQEGFRVAPFKSQNMSNNSFVTPEGGEIGRSSAFQAQACGIEPHVDMNPILLKPSSETGAQVVVLGKVVKVMSAREYHQYQPQLLEVIQESFQRLSQENDIVVIEGAGSPAEINLRPYDIVNMATARMASAPVVIVGDINLGGVFAWLVGTLELLTVEERALVKAFIINKFRGDISLLYNGLEMLENMTGKKVLGVLPCVKDLAVAEEDGIPDSKWKGPWVPDPTKLQIQVFFCRIFRTPRILKAWNSSPTWACATWRKRRRPANPFPTCSSFRGRKAPWRTLPTCDPRGWLSTSAIATNRAPPWWESAVAIKCWAGNCLTPWGLNRARRQWKAWVSSKAPPPLSLKKPPNRCAR